MEQQTIRLDPEQMMELAEAVAQRLFELQNSSRRPRPVTLAPESIDAVARRVLELQGAIQSPELDLAGAMSLTKHSAKQTFHDWCRRRGVKAIARGRYRRAALLRALGA